MGNPQAVATPKMNALVAEGIHLERAYAYKVRSVLSQHTVLCLRRLIFFSLVIHQFCSPSRCSLLSGRLPIHVNTNNDADLPRAGIPEAMTTLPEKLSAAGYDCHQVSDLVRQRDVLNF